jgi:hypothetical protein
VSLQEIAALVRRHVLVVGVILAIAAGVAYTFKHTPVQYQESGTIVLKPPLSAADPNPYSSFGGSLTEAAGTIALLMMSPQSQAQVVAAGGTATYDVALVNTGNLSSPIFGFPDVTVTATSEYPAAAHLTFVVVTRLFAQELAARQARAGATLASHIQPQLVGDTGVAATPGSSKRVFGGLLVLTAVAALSAASFLDRHPVRLRPPGLLSRVAIGNGQGVMTWLRSFRLRMPAMPTVRRRRGLR